MMGTFADQLRRKTGGEIGAPITIILRSIATRLRVEAEGDAAYQLFKSPGSIYFCKPNIHARFQYFMPQSPHQY